MTTQTPISEEELRNIYRRCDVSNNRTDDPLSEDEFVALIKQYGNQCRVDELGRIMSRTEVTAQQDVYYNQRISELTQTNEEES